MNITSNLELHQQLGIACSSYYWRRFKLCTEIADLREEVLTAINCHEQSINKSWRDSRREKQLPGAKHVLISYRCLHWTNMTKGFGRLCRNCAENHCQHFLTYPILSCKTSASLKRHYVLSLQLEIENHDFPFRRRNEGKEKNIPSVILL